MKIKVENLSREQAMELLENVQKNCASAFAIQGEKTCRFITTNTVTATVRPDTSGEYDDYSRNTFEIQSEYWTESSLREFAGIQ